MNQENHQEASQQQDENKKPYIPASQAADIYRSPTDAVRRQHTTPYANSGTNVSYEGPTAPGSGGSAAIGGASGQPVDGSRIATTRTDETGDIGRHGDQAEGNNDIGTPPPPNDTDGATSAGEDRPQRK